MDHKTNAEFMKKDDFKDAMTWANTGNTNTSQTGVFNTVGGMPIVVSKYMRQTEADGKVSGATPANNTKGTVMLVKRNIIQHGFLGGMDMMTHKILGRGYVLQAAISFGFANINKSALSPTRVVAGINATV